MKHTLALLCGCVAAGCLAGCTHYGTFLGSHSASRNDGVVRGQNPGGPYPPPMMMQTGHGEMGPVYYDGPAHGSDCPVCPTGCPKSDVWRPTHHHTWEYDAPKGLVYPPQNQMPAVYQYPYYTVKGPTDFFYTGE